MRHWFACSNSKWNSLKSWVHYKLHSNRIGCGLIEFNIISVVNCAFRLIDELELCNWLHKPTIDYYLARILCFILHALFQFVCYFIYKILLQYLPQHVILYFKYIHCIIFNIWIDEMLGVGIPIANG